MTPTLDQLLTDLTAAVRAGDRTRALDLARQIQQRLLTETMDRARVERALLAALEMPRAELPSPAVKSLAPERGGAEATDGVVYPVWLGTNRAPDGRGDFTSERHPQTTLGRVLVHVPQAHRFGETGSPFWKRLLRFDLRDDRLRVQEVAARESAAFFAEVGAALEAARESGDEPQALVYLHGYNTDFEDAVIRAAQIGFDLKVPGATACFSWPSRGTVAGYPADEATIEASEGAIARFLLDFAAGCGDAKVNVVAHSMGNRGLLRALQRIAGSAGTRGGKKPGRCFWPRRTSTAGCSWTWRTCTRPQASAPPSTPPTATWRCTPRRSCTRPRAPATSSPTPWHRP